MNTVYFLVDGVRHSNRRSAELYKRQYNISDPIIFVDGPELDFSIPNITLQYAVNQRCQSLRDQYKWLQLFYSGGSDSHTILKSFIDQDIPLNEIVMSRWSCTEEWDHLHNIEITQTATNFIADNFSYFNKHKVKITYCNFDSKKIAEVYSNQDFLERVCGIRIDNPGSIFHMVYAFPELTHYDSLCQIVGWEKPTVKVLNGEVYTFFVDKTISFIPDDKTNSKFEFFYLEDPVLSVVQYRIAKTIVLDIMKIHCDTIVANSNEEYFKLVNQFARTANYCELSNTQLIGKSFDHAVPYKERAFFKNLQQHLPSTWKQLTEYCNTTDIVQLYNFCDFASDNNGANVIGLVGTERRIL